jgi:hypothetical protein
LVPPWPVTRFELYNQTTGKEYTAKFRQVSETAQEMETTRQPSILHRLILPRPARCRSPSLRQCTQPDDTLPPLHAMPGCVPRYRRQMAFNLKRIQRASRGRSGPQKNQANDNVTARPKGTANRGTTLTDNIQRRTRRMQMDFNLKTNSKLRADILSASDDALDAATLVRFSAEVRNGRPGCWKPRAHTTRNPMRHSRVPCGSSFGAFAEA